MRDIVNDCMEESGTKPISRWAQLDSVPTDHMNSILKVMEFAQKYFVGCFIGGDLVLSPLLVCNPRQTDCELAFKHI